MSLRGDVATGGATTSIVSATVGGSEATCAGGRVAWTATQPSTRSRLRVVVGPVGRPWIRVPAPDECKQLAARQPRCLGVEGGEGRREGGVAVDEEGGVPGEAVEVARGVVRKKERRKEIPYIEGKMKDIGARVGYTVL